MRVLSAPECLGDPPTPVSLAIGVFDGVHRGHALVIQHTLEEAQRTHGRAVTVTFDRHPNAVVAPERTPPMLYPLWRRLEAIESLGIDTSLVFQFTSEFSRQSGEEFVHRLILGFGKVASICVGKGFVFGHRRSGNLELLRSLGERDGFTVHGVPPVEEEGEPISSTRVRDLVTAGEFARASHLLGRTYSLAGTVVAGDRLGRELGYPTANLDVTGLVLPPTGVYAAIALGRDFRRVAAVNIGSRPTISGGGKVRVEAHLIDFTGSLYGERLELELQHRLRGEQRFPSRDALIRQLEGDMGEVRAWGGNKGLL